ncbi:hypothetical protein ACVDFE_36315 [Lentzea chajnantorensis]
MADGPTDQLRSPVLIELCLLLRDFLDDLDLTDLNDDDLYRHIAFAVSLQHSGRDFTARPAPEARPGRSRRAAAAGNRAPGRSLTAVAPGAVRDGRDTAQGSGSR